MAYKGGVPVNSGFYPRNDFPIAEAKDIYVSDEQRLDTALEGLQSDIAGKADEGHSHDDLYYTEAEVDAAIDEAINGITAIPDSEIIALFSS